MNFENLGLLPQILKAVNRAGYEQPTPIQQAAIPPALKGKDVLGCAQTGTGKSAAFCIPALQMADATAGDQPELTTLILTPTRELAAQINESLETYGKFLDIWHTVIFGGVNEKPQIAELKRGVDILVATPGRLLDLLRRKLVRLDRIKLFVLDEADRMLDMGFIRDVREIVKALPKQRQTLFFSATMPPEIRELANGLLHDPAVVAVDPVSSTAEAIEQKVYFTDKNSKRDLLLHILKDPECERCVVFTRTKHGANRVAQHLERSGKGSAAIHGNKSQGARTRALEGFRDGSIRVLVATDIAARGIDVKGITHVINFDVPNIPETYVHRIGRTARAGKSGVALSLCEPDERSWLSAIERLMKQRIPKVEDHPFPERPGAAAAAEPRQNARPARPSAGGKRPSRGGRGRPSSRGAGRGQSARASARA